MVTVGTGTDVIEELADVHQQIQALFKELLEEAPGAELRKRLLDRLTVELVRYLDQEEAFLHPAVRRFLTDGDRISADDLASHGRIEDLLRELEARDADDPDFDQLVTVLRNEAVAHIDDVHHTVFAPLRQDSPPSTREELGDRFRRARESTDAYPPSALTPGTGLVDRAHDPHGPRP